MIRKQNSKIKAHIKSEPLRRARTAPHWGTAAQSDQGKVTFSGHKTLLQPHTHTHTHTQATTQARSKKNNKILFSRLLTLTLTASKSYEPYSLSLPAVPRQKLSLTAWPHKMPSYIQSLPRVPKKITREKQQQYKQAQVEILQLPFARQISSQEDSWQVHFNGITSKREPSRDREKERDKERLRESKR